jgi:hypothetical protein
MRTEALGRLNSEKDRVLLQLWTTPEARKLARVIAAHDSLSISGLLRKALDADATDPESPAPEELKAQLRLALRETDRSWAPATCRGEG